jgi:hypothetical protein
MASDDSCGPLAANALNTSFDEHWKAPVFSKLLAALRHDRPRWLQNRRRLSHSDTIHRTADAEPPAVHDVGVDHCGANVGMPKSFCRGPDVVTRFRQMRREGTPGLMTSDTLRERRASAASVTAR